jgi:ferredoxin
VVEKNKITGVHCAEVDFRGFKNGRPDFDEIPESEHILPADLVVWAIGQEPDLTFLPQDDRIALGSPFGIRSDEELMTTQPGVFVSGDVRRGQTTFVIDAIGDGHKAARGIDRYLRGEKGIPEPIALELVEFSLEESKTRFQDSRASKQLRTSFPTISVKDWVGNFTEVDLPITEEEAVTEASRCLLCGTCSECLACVFVCEPGAIDHNQLGQFKNGIYSHIVYADTTDVTPHLDEFSENGVYLVDPQDVLKGSAVAARLLQDINTERQTKTISTFTDVKDSPARIGVFICQCGEDAASGQISAVVDTESISGGVADQPGVVHSQVLPFSCSPKGSSIIDAAVNDHNLNRVVLAACSCCNIDQVCYSCTYQRVRCKENFGLFDRIQHSQIGVGSTRFELVNIREQCAWVHSDDPPVATEIASKLIEATIARAITSPGKRSGARSISKTATLIGNGPAAPLSEKALTQLGIESHWVKEIPKEINRSEGFYNAILAEKSWRSATLILVPKNKREKDKLMAAFGQEGKRPRINTRWGGLESHRPGVFFIDPKMDAAVSGSAAAARVKAWIGRTENRPPTAAIVDPDRCRACNTCIEVCEYGAPELVETNGRYASWIDPAMCQACGTCAAHCPSGAITAGCTTDAQLEAMLDVILMP